MKLIRRFGVPFAAALLAALVASSIAPVRATIGAGRGHAAHHLKPLVDTHEFMEHVVEGAYATLKQGLSEKPADSKAWRRVRDMGLLLGESGNLLLIRPPDDADATEWSKLSVELRESGAALLKAAKVKDYDASRTAYLALVHACNSCHAKYGDDGEPTIMP